MRSIFRSRIDNLRIPRPTQQAGKNFAGSSRVPVGCQALIGHHCGILHSVPVGLSNLLTPISSTTSEPAVLSTPWQGDCLLSNRDWFSDERVTQFPIPVEGPRSTVGREFEHPQAPEWKHWCAEFDHREFSPGTSATSGQQRLETCSASHRRRFPGPGGTIRNPLRQALSHRVFCTSQ
jgi:hypothetical protein